MSVNEIYDPIREKFVDAQPEEVIRQKWIQYLIKLGYPKHLMAVEKKLEAVSSIEKGLTHKFPKRRVDLLAYYKDVKGHLKPLVIIEFKAIELSEKALYQVQGYNSFVLAPFVAIANDKEVIFGYEENGILNTYDFIPKYEELIKVFN